MDSTDPFNQLLKCLEKQLGTLDSWDRRILDYWYVCGRQLTREADEIDRELSTSEWTAHASILWNDLVSCYNQLWSDFQLYNLSDEETDLLIELGLIVRQVAELTASTPATRLSDEELFDGGILPLLDIFYQWGEVRRLQAFLSTNAGFITLAELEKKLEEITNAINQCLGGSD